LDPTHGIFASSVPLKDGIENAYTRMREKMIRMPITNRFLSFEGIPPLPGQNSPRFSCLPAQLHAATSAPGWGDRHGWYLAGISQDAEVENCNGK